MTAKRRILVPLDGSDSADRAAVFAADLARDTGAQLVLLHVYDAPRAVAMGLLPVAPAGLDDSQAKLVQAAFNKAKVQMQGVEPAEYLIEIGDPAERIVQVAKSRDMTQIVMGSRGLSPIKELVLGSVSEKVARLAHCAVTVVR